MNMSIGTSINKYFSSPENNYHTPPVVFYLEAFRKD